MSEAPKNPSKDQHRAKLGLWLGLGALALILVLFLFGRYTEFLNLDDLQRAIATFSEGPWGVPALILTFCGCAFIGVPQFILIGIAVYAFGPLWGAVWSWVATLSSGTITFWVGRFFGQATLQRFGEGRIKRFTDFVARNAFAASAIVRNVPTGPFLMVNMIFGAIRANYLHYLSGMAIGVIPKIALVAFGLQAIQAALRGNLLVAAGAGVATLAVFLGGFFYVRHRRRKGENIAFSAE
ncbi:MAG: VTT domain-containing protein [Pseudomonadota bacterium]